MITIKTYKELTDFMTAFGDAKLNMLVICSRGGLGKTEEVRRTLNGEDDVNIGGHVTPLKLYELLYNNQGKRIIFDEIDGLLTDSKHVGLLKQLCETRERKKIMWSSSDRRATEIDGGAGHFYTRSHVLMLCNSFEALNANVGALQTRAIVVQFIPPSMEILAKIKTFAQDDEIILFLEQFHECLPEFSLRSYGILQDLKNAGLDWRRHALDESNTPAKVVEIADLLSRYNTDTECVKHYSGSRRDYYNWKPDAVAYMRRRTLAHAISDLRILSA